MPVSEVMESVVLRATLEPWPAVRDARGERIAAACADIVSGPYAEVDAPTRITTRMTAPQQLEFTVASIGDVRDRIEGLRVIALLACELMIDSPDAKLTWEFSGVSLNRTRLQLALAEWGGADIPIDALIAFNFSVWSEGRQATGAMTKGLRAIIGQEVACWPKTPELRRNYQNALVQVAHWLIKHGPIRRAQRLYVGESPINPVQLEPYGDFDNPTIVEVVAV